MKQSRHHRRSAALLDGHEQTNVIMNSLTISSSVLTSITMNQPIALKGAADEWIRSKQHDQAKVYFILRQNAINKRAGTKRGDSTLPLSRRNLKLMHMCNSVVTIKPARLAEKRFATSGGLFVIPENEIVTDPSILDDFRFHQIRDPSIPKEIVCYHKIKTSKSCAVIDQGSSNKGYNHYSLEDVASSPEQNRVAHAVRMPRHLSDQSVIAPPAITCSRKAKQEDEKQNNEQTKKDDGKAKHIDCFKIMGRAVWNFLTLHDSKSSTALFFVIIWILFELKLTV